MSIAVRHARLVKAVHIRDINEPLISLWQRIIKDPAGLAFAYDRLWNEQLPDPRTYYEQIRAKFNATHDPELLLYLLARCVKAAVRYNRNGEFNQGADDRRLGARPATMRRRILATSGVLAGATATPGDYGELLSGAAPRDVVYLDPPYQGVSNTRDHRYMRGLDRADFLAELRGAVRAGVSFILSYDGATGGKVYGEPLPSDFGLLHLHLYGGTSSQATLNGRDLATVESLYLSPALVDRLGGEVAVAKRLSGR